MPFLAQEPVAGEIIPRENTFQLSRVQQPSHLARVAHEPGETLQGHFVDFINVLAQIVRRHHRAVQRASEQILIAVGELQPLHQRFELLRRAAAEGLAVHLTRLVERGAG